MEDKKRILIEFFDTDRYGMNNWSPFAFNENMPRFSGGTPLGITIGISKAYIINREKELNRLNLREKKRK